MNTEQIDLLARIKTRWPNEAKYRVSLESTPAEPEGWFIRLENDMNVDAYGFGANPDQAFAVLERNEATREPAQECRARRVKELEAQLAALLGEVTKPKEVA